MTTPAPLDPTRDYSKSAQLAQHGITLSRRQVDIPYYTAPAGYCRWCGRGTEGKRSWHPDCVTAYWHHDPKVQRKRTYERAGGTCAACGRHCPLHGDWANDHIVPLADGGANTDENLQLLCAPCHTEKTSREATARAAARRPDGGQLALEETT